MTSEPKVVKIRFVIIRKTLDTGGYGGNFEPNNGPHNAFLQDITNYLEDIGNNGFIHNPNPAWPYIPQANELTSKRIAFKLMGTTYVNDDAGFDWDNNFSTHFKYPISNLATNPYAEINIFFYREAHI